MFSRVMYCEDCAKLHNPQHGQKFAVKGRSSKLELAIYQVTSPQSIGFTPHLVEKQFISNGMVTYVSYCGIHNCGVDIKQTDTEDNYKIGLKKGLTGRMTTKEWNAMVQFKGDTGYELDR